MRTQAPEITPSALPPPMALLQMATSVWISQALYIAAKLGIADLLHDQPRSSEDLARATGMHAPSLYRVLRALSSAGVFAEDGNGRFEMSPLAEPLRTDVPNSVRHITIMMGEPWHARAISAMLYSVRTGEPAFAREFGTGLFDFLTEDSEAAAVFNEAMANLSSLDADAIVAAYDFSGVRTLVDIGGGQGRLLSAILRANPGLRGVLFDTPEVIEGASLRIQEAGLADRCELAAGNFFEAVPEGGDAYLLRHIVHDWADERAVAILRNCHGAMNDRGRLLVVETVIMPGNDPSFGKLLDLEMLFLTDGGRERSANEFRELFGAAGFRLSRILPMTSELSIIEGVRE